MRGVPLGMRRTPPQCPDLRLAAADAFTRQEPDEDEEDEEEDDRKEDDDDEGTDDGYSE